jgi:hypothetical protein
MKDDRYEVWNPVEQPESNDMRRMAEYEFNDEINAVHNPEPSWMDKAFNIRPHFKQT